MLKVISFGIHVYTKSLPGFVQVLEVLAITQNSALVFKALKPMKNSSFWSTCLKVLEFP